MDMPGDNALKFRKGKGFFFTIFWRLVHPGGYFFNFPPDGMRDYGYIIFLLPQFCTKYKAGPMVMEFMAFSLSLVGINFGTRIARTIRNSP